MNRHSLARMSHGRRSFSAGAWKRLLAAFVVAGLVGLGAAPVGAAQGAPDAALQHNLACVSTALTNYGFADVPNDHPHRSAINCLAHYGISTGTGDGTVYSPNRTVPRWQMALFVQRATIVAGVVLPPPRDQGLEDIGGLSQATQDAINQLVAARISAGHTASAYRPDDVVTRAQMAQFIVNFLGYVSDTVKVGLQGTVTLSASNGAFISKDDRFDDTEDLSYAIQQATSALYELGIALGVGGDNFAPGLPVTRAQMAAFITRALGFTTARPRPDAPTVDSPRTAAPALATWKSRSWLEADPVAGLQREVSEASLDASAHNRQGPYKDTYARITVTCRNGHVHIGLDTQGGIIGYQAILNGTPVYYQFGDLPLIVEVWELDRFNNAIIWLPWEKRATFIENLREHDDKQISMTVYNQVNAEYGHFVFSVATGRTHHLEPVLDTCNWPSPD